MPAPTANTEGFAALLGKALQTPELASDVGKDLPDGFPLPVAAHHRVVDTTNDPGAIEGAVAYDFTCRRDVFLIFRPYDGCNRCSHDIAQNVVQIPQTGDYTCPHTRLSEYEAVLNRTLAGEYLFGSENEVVQKDGSILISLKWFEKKISKRKPKKRMPADGPTMQKEEPDL
jgi:hypothetical protein